MIRDYHTGSDPDLIFYLSRIPDPGVKKRHRIPDPDLQHCEQGYGSGCAAEIGRCVATVLAHNLPQGTVSRFQIPILDENENCKMFKIESKADGLFLKPRIQNWIKYYRYLILQDIQHRNRGHRRKRK